VKILGGTLGLRFVLKTALALDKKGQTHQRRLWGAALLLPVREKDKHRKEEAQRKRAGMSRGGWPNEK